MSLSLAKIIAADPRKKLTRAQCIALSPEIIYDDGRTIQCHKDECDINKIMARFEVTGTISHVNQYQGRYVDFSNYDFQEHQNTLNAGEAIFDALPAEIRREFHQDPTKFFEHVNDPANREKENFGLPALAKPGYQLPPAPTNNDADTQAAAAAAASSASPPAAEPAAPNPEPTPSSE